MENASKALIIAGGVLLAVIIIGILVYTWGNVSSFVSSQDDLKDQQQLASFNKQFESYYKSLLRGAEVASIINKVRSNNVAYEDNLEYKITCKIKIKEAISGGLNAAEHDVSKYNATSEYDRFVATAENLKTFKRLYFRCTKIGYSNKTGRVNEVVFEELTTSEIKSYFPSAEPG